MPVKPVKPVEPVPAGFDYKTLAICMVVFSLLFLIALTLVLWKAGYLNWCVCILNCPLFQTISRENNVDVERPAIELSLIDL